jgi:hypothetical protein
MDGPAAQRIWGAAVLREMAKDIAKPNPYRPALTAELTRDATFLRGFQAGLQSGNAIRVQRALTELGTRLHAAIGVVYGADRLARIDRAAREFGDHLRRLQGRPDYASGTGLRDFADADPLRGKATAAAPRAGIDTTGTDGLFVFSSANFFRDQFFFFQNSEFIQSESVLAAVLLVELAVIIILFIFFTLVIPEVPVGRTYSAGIEQFRREQLVARFAARLATR